LSGTPLIIYASACTAAPGKAASELLQIDFSDKVGFHTILEELDGPKLDILIHSPGGSAEATETIVEEIRRKFNRVRFIVPSFAKSAAAMMVMSGNEILMDEDAELGPIDPQMFTRNGVVPGDAIKEQFQKASDDILQDPRKAQVWFPILQMLGPGLLAQCDNASALAKNLVKDWLIKYMFDGVADGAAKADAIATFLSDHGYFKSHGRRVKLEHLLDKKVAVANLRDNANFYRAVWELYCAVDILLTNTPVFKVFYNSVGTAMVRQQQTGILQMPMMQIAPGMLPTQQQPQAPLPAPQSVFQKASRFMTQIPQRLRAVLPGQRT
jgi:Serine dehydrogenase proteinase